MQAWASVQPVPVCGRMANGWWLQLLRYAETGLVAKAPFRVADRDAAKMGVNLRIVHLSGSHRR